MSSRAQTVRLSASKYRVLADFAKKRGLSDYAMLARIVEAGFLAMLHGTDKETDLAELAHEIGAISARLAEAERVLDRTLFTACAAYAYPSRRRGQQSPVQSHSFRTVFRSSAHQRLSSCP